MLMLYDFSLRFSFFVFSCNLVVHLSSCVCNMLLDFCSSFLRCTAIVQFESRNNCKTIFFSLPMNDVDLASRYKHSLDVPSVFISQLRRSHSVYISRKIDR